MLGKVGDFAHLPAPFDHATRDSQWVECSSVSAWHKARRRLGKHGLCVTIAAQLFA
jgi:hypothetical protein